MAKQTITFKKKRLGSWTRDDGELCKIVNEESMYRELEKLIDDGWQLSTDTDEQRHIRQYEMTKI